MAAAPLDLPIARPATERCVYTWAALVALVLVFAGFAPTYYLKGAFAAPELNLVKHIHGVVMTAWFAFFLVQVRLVATGNVLIHRKLGVAGAFLAVLVVVMGLQVAIASARAGATPLPSIPPLVFLVMPLAELALFTALFTAAIVLRKRSAWHKRLMLVATISMLTPAMARLPFEFVRIGGPPAFFGLTDLVILGCIAFDTVKNRRLHPAFMVGLAVVIVGQLGRLAFSQTAAWMTFAKWLTA
ncbi:MAG: hypothetical protein ABI789_00235 [Usitatibacter sp.]